MKSKRLLLVRLDKIGDLVCTLGADATRGLEDYERLWVISKGLSFIADHISPSPPNYVELDKRQPWTSFWMLTSFLRKWKPDIAISFQGPWWVHFAFWLMSVPIRSGVLSQWHSFFFLNKGLRQRRSLAEKHEADYNQELLCHALGLPQQLGPIIKLKLNDRELSQGGALLRAYQLEEGNYIVVHPGMAGSARNWPAHKYSELIERLLPNETVVVTGTEADSPWCDPLFEKLPHGHPNLRNMKAKLNPQELLYILWASKQVIAPSTGVLHLAAALGCSTIGIYSPVRVHLARRWGPRSAKNAAATITLTPSVECPGLWSCLGEKCPHFDCMRTIDVPLLAPPQQT